MGQGQFSNEQIVALLQEAEKGVQSIAAFCKAKGIIETVLPPFYEPRALLVPAASPWLACQPAANSCGV
jgi:hypothetical protein